MPALQDRRWTVSEVHALPDDPRHRYEVVDGELLVSPGPSWAHQYMVRLLTRALEDHLSAHRVGVALNGPAEIDPDAHSMVQPDVFVVPRVDGRPPRDWPEAGRLLLAVEVLSPGTARHDRVVKRRLYQRLGAEYWILDLDARVVERWTPGATRPEIVEDVLAWSAVGDAPPLRLELGPLFRAAPDAR